MDTVNIYNAKTNLSNFVERAARGEEIVIAKAGRPLARLVPLARRTTPRPFGLLAGKVTVGEDFDDPFRTMFAGHLRVLRAELPARHPCFHLGGGDSHSPGCATAARLGDARKFRCCQQCDGVGNCDQGCDRTPYVSGRPIR